MMRLPKASPPIKSGPVLLVWHYVARTLLEGALLLYDFSRTRVGNRDDLTVNLQSQIGRTLD